MLLSAIAFVIVFGLVVLVHEWGHFVMARRAGIVVKEFGFGYPPRLKTLAVRDGVKYTLNAIPVGGFVRMLGEEDPSEPGSFASKSASVRIGTLLAGSGMNLVLAAALFAAVFLIGEQVAVGRVVVESVAPHSPAEQAGVLPGDIVTVLEGREIRNPGELVERTLAVQGREVSVSLLRDGRQIVVRLTPRLQPPPGEGAMGVTIAMQQGYEVKTVRYPIWEAVYLGVREVWMTFVLMITGFARMFRVGISPGDITGPVGIFQISGAIAQTGLTNLMRFTGFLSLNLLILNLLPLPALDGGRIAFVVLEKMRGGRRVAPQQEGLVHFVGLLVLLALTVVISYFDILRILGGSPFP
jgi:regulator of sigma E protease